MPKRNPPGLSRDTDRHGNVRWYVRVPGKPKVRIREDYGTPAFWLAYSAALAGRPLAKADSREEKVPALSGSLRQLCELYFGSADFKSLDATTRRVRRSVLERLCQERAANRQIYGDLPYRALLAKHVLMLRDKRAEAPGAANSMVKALRQLFAFAVARKLTATNPAKDVPYLPKVLPDGIPAWTEADVEAFKATHPEGSMARLALSLFLEFGQRISDVYRLGPGMVSGGTITFTQWKNRNRKPVTLALPISEELGAVIAALPAGRVTFLVNEFGRPFASTAAFGNKFRDWCREAGLVGRSAHGLRKYFSAKLAEDGASDREIMAFTGHTTSKEVDRYTRSASQKRLAQSARQRLAANRIVPPQSATPESETKHEAKPLFGNSFPEGMVPRDGIKVIK